MKRERNDLKAGIFILASVALIIGVVIAIKGVGRMLEPSQAPVITFKLTDDIAGLREGDDVRVGGFKIGVVRDIELVHAEGSASPYILVRCSVPARVTIRKDARVTVQGTLTGTSWLNFDDLGSSAAPVLAAGDRLAGHPGMMSTLLASAGDLVPELTGTVREVRTVTIPKVNDTIDTYQTTGRHATALIKYVRSKIDPVVERFYAIADTGRDALAQVRDVFGESKGDFKTTIANLSSATGTVKDRLPGIFERVEGSLAKIQITIDSTNVALEDIKAVAANTKDATGSARSILVGNRGKIDDMIASLKAAGDNLKFATAEIRRSPWRLLYKPQPGEVANLNLYDSARQFAEGANDLNDAATALRDALKDPAISDQQVRELVERLDKSFHNFSSIEQELWERVR